MDPQAVKELLEGALAGCTVHVEGDGRHFNIQVVGNIFAGKRPVQRQQLVYGVLNEKIAEGSIHAVNMVTLTPEEQTPEEQS